MNRNICLEYSEVLIIAAIILSVGVVVMTIPYIPYVKKNFAVADDLLWEQRRFAFVFDLGFCIALLAAVISGIGTGLLEDTYSQLCFTLLK